MTFALHPGRPAREVRRRSTFRAGRITALLALVALLLVACQDQPEPAPGPLPGATPHPNAKALSAAAPLAGNVLAFNSDRTGNFEIFTMKADGSSQKQLTNDASQDSWWGRISPDRRTILFYRSPKGVHDLDYSKVSLWMMNADGSNQRMVLAQRGHGWEVHGHAEWSPDGTSLVMFGGVKINPQVFVTDAAGDNPRAVTNRSGQNLDPSWSPDGKTIVFVGCPAFICFEKDYEIYTTPTAGGEAVRLTNNQLRDHDPYYSPDGQQIAWLVESQPGKFGPVGAWDIMVMNAGGSSQHKLTSDGQINSKPHWSLDGSLVYFHRFAPGPGALWTIYQIKPDGSGLAPLTASAQGNNEYPSN